MPGIILGTDDTMVNNIDDKPLLPSWPLLSSGRRK